MSKDTENISSQVLFIFFAHFSHFNFYFISPVSHRPLDSVALTGERYVVHDMYKVSCTLCGDLVV